MEIWTFVDYYKFHKSKLVMLSFLPVIANLGVYSFGSLNRLPHVSLALVCRVVRRSDVKPEFSRERELCDRGGKAK